jgi:hypothetical protein
MHVDFSLELAVLTRVCLGRFGGAVYDTGGRVGSIPLTKSLDGHRSTVMIHKVWLKVEFKHQHSRETFIG